MFMTQTTTDNVIVLNQFVSFPQDQFPDRTFVKEMQKDLDERILEGVMELTQLLTAEVDDKEIDFVKVCYELMVVILITSFNYLSHYYTYMVSYSVGSCLGMAKRENNSYFKNKVFNCNANALMQTISCDSGICY